MGVRHFVMLVVILLIGYWLGAKYPGLLSHIPGM